MDKFQDHSYSVGFLMSAKNNLKIAIFSIYITPQENLKKELFEAITQNHKNFIIVGDLNAKNKQWHCKNTNPKGILLEQITLSNNLHILNNKTPTYGRSKSIIDLSICSNSLRSNFSNFKVL